VRHGSRGFGGRRPPKNLGFFEPGDAKFLVRVDDFSGCKNTVLKCC